MFANVITFSVALSEKLAPFDMLLSESITVVDSDEDFTASLASGAHLNYDEFDCIRVLREITYEEVRTALGSIDLTNCAISIIKKGKDL